MERICIQDPATGSSAEFLPELGFNCCAFRPVLVSPAGRRWELDVIEASPEFLAGQASPSGYGIPLLFPYPNRIREGRFSWNGQNYELSPEQVFFDGTGNAIHGLCLDRPWRVVKQSEQSVEAEFQLSSDAPDRKDCWPADFVIRARYTVEGSSLRLVVTIRNPDSVPLPWGFGTHPYFRVPLAADSHAESCLVEVPASEQWELIQCLPTGKRISVSPECDLREGAAWGTLHLDHVLTGLSYEGDVLKCGLVDQEAGLELVQRCGKEFREVVVYTPPGRNSVCLEPYTCVTDAVNLQAKGIESGWRVLNPGEELQLWVDIRVGLVVA